MIVKRSKDDPTQIGLFMRGSHGGIELYSPAQEFTLDTLRQRAASIAVSEPSVIEPDVAPPMAEHPLSNEAKIAAELPAHGAPPDTPFGFPGLTGDPLRGARHPILLSVSAAPRGIGNPSHRIPQPCRISRAIRSAGHWKEHCARVSH